MHLGRRGRPRGRSECQRHHTCRQLCEQGLQQFGSRGAGHSQVLGSALVQGAGLPRKQLPAGQGQLVLGRSSCTPCGTTQRSRAHAGSVQVAEALVTKESLLPARRDCPLAGVFPAPQHLQCAPSRDPQAPPLPSHQPQARPQRPFLVTVPWMQPGLGPATPSFELLRGLVRGLHHSRRRQEVPDHPLSQPLGPDQELLSEPPG